MLHFLVAGFALFIVYGSFHGSPTSNDPRRIEISADEVRRIEISWMAQWQRPPNAQEMRGLIDEYVKEEVLYREAVALGLDRDDSIVRRRLAQKMDFLVEDVAALREPAPGELEAWYAKNQQRFAPPPLATFRHVFFASDKRGAGAEGAARKVLATLASRKVGAGDEFVYKDAYVEQTPEQVARVFGSRFAGSLFEQAPGAWRGPLESGYGWHLVWIDALKPGEPPAFETVVGQAKADWLSEQRAESKRARLEAIMARYEIFVTAPGQQSGKTAAR